MPTSVRSGFTLVEMSIVLIIVGLIAGAILVGRDLIAAATIRATMSQIEKYETAVMAFQLKYNYLPGDIPVDQAMQTGLIARSGGDGDGNGNGVLEGLGLTPNALDSWLVLGGETVFFWTDLSSAGLIDGAFHDSSDAVAPDCGFPGDPSPSPTPCNAVIPAFLPSAKTGRGGVVIAFNSTSRQWDSATSQYTDAMGGVLFELAAVRVVSHNGLMGVVPALTVMETYSIDAKRDDGLPLSGNMVVAAPDRVVVGTGYNPAGKYSVFRGTTSQFCVSNAASNPYNLAYPDSLGCSFIMRTNF